MSRARKNFIKSLRAPALLAAGYAGSSILPKYLGYKDKGDSNSLRGVSVASGAAASSISMNPSAVLPKFLQTAFEKAVGKTKYKNINKYAPVIGAGWGAVSGLGSHELGRAARKGKEMIEKNSGMIDPVQDTLAPDLFDENQQMHEDIRQELLATLSTVISLDKVEKALMGGSLTGFQYNPDSDVDVTVYITDPPESWIGSGKSELVGDISHLRFKSPRSNRTYQYYVLPWNEDTRRGLQDREYGLYDIKKGDWHTPPRPRDEYPDPEFRYRAQLIVARSRAKYFDQLVKRYKQDYRKYKNYKDGRYNNYNWSPNINTFWKRRAQQALKEVANFTNDIYISRHSRYSAGWGVPRKAKANVVFKLIEYGPHGEFFDKVRKLEMPERLEDIKLIKC